MITLTHISLTCVQLFTSFLLFVSLNPAYFKLVSSRFSTDAPYGLYVFSFPNHFLDPRWVSVLFLLSGCTYDCFLLMDNPFNFCRSCKCSSSFKGQFKAHFFPKVTSMSHTLRQLIYLLITYQRFNEQILCVLHYTRCMTGCSQHGTHSFGLQLHMLTSLPKRIITFQRLTGPAIPLQYPTQLEYLG